MLPSHISVMRRSVVHGGHSIIVFILVVCSIGSSRAVALVIVHGGCLVISLVLLDISVLAVDLSVLLILVGLLVITGAVAAV